MKIYYIVGLNTENGYNGIDWLDDTSILRYYYPSAEAAQAALDAQPSTREEDADGIIGGFEIRCSDAEPDEDDGCVRTVEDTHFAVRYPTSTSGQQIWPAGTPLDADGWAK